MGQENGAKGGTVYVDGSRDAQVLTLYKDEPQNVQLDIADLGVQVEKRDVPVESDSQIHLRSKAGKNIGVEIGDICPICGEGTVEDISDRRQAERIFGREQRHVYPLVCGFETDEEALSLHGNNGDQLDLSTLAEGAASSLEPRLAALLPDMPAQVRADLLPLLLGNLAHIAEVRAQNSRAERLLDIEHREWVICVGRGFDFLHMPNLALIIGPYSPDLADPLRKAAGIIHANMKAGRIPNDGFLLLASVPYEEIGVDRARAEMKARFLSHFAAAVIEKERPALAARMTQRTAVLDWGARRLEPIAP